jgi:predicted nucleic acid-binding protein
MSIVIDTSAVIAVIVAEPTRRSILAATAGQQLLAPGSLPWEVGNALSALMKRGRLVSAQSVEAARLYAKIPIRLISVSIADALRLAADERIYAYDACVLACAMKMNAPILTLDDRLRAVALGLNVSVVEV